MTHHSSIDLFLWAAGFLFHVILLMVLALRKRVKQFPCFSALIVLNLLRTATLYVITQLGSSVGYFYTYWSLAVVDEIVQLAIIYELGSQVFRNTGRWAKDARPGLLLWSLASVVAATVFSILAPVQTDLTVQAVVIKGSLFSAMLLTELFVGMIVLSATVGLPWRTHTARIAQGLGTYSLITVLIETGHIYLGLQKNNPMYAMLSHTRAGIYLICLTYWIVTLWPNVVRKDRMTQQMQEQLAMLMAVAARHRNTAWFLGDRD